MQLLRLHVLCISLASGASPPMVMSTDRSSICDWPDAMDTIRSSKFTLSGLYHLAKKCAAFT